jgi:DNA-binding FadR family transcriptional regulator
MDSPAAFLEPVGSRRAFEEIIDQIRGAIEAGHLAAGDRLPSERELAERFAVSRTSVREALRVLEALAVVSVRRGADNGATLLERPGDAFSKIFAFLLSLGHVSVEHLVEFRAMLESWAASMCATRRDEELVARLRALANEMDGSPLSVYGFHELDSEFHSELIAASGNGALVLVAEGSRKPMRAVMQAVLLAQAAWPVAQRELALEHRQIVDAIERGNPSLASALVADHVVRWGRDFAASAAKPEREPDDRRPSWPRVL